MDIQNPDHDPSQTKICFKIKIPGSLSEAPVEEDGGNGGGGAAGARGDLHDQLPPGYRACEYCGKIFSSGKAWGGHKRHHLKLLRENNRKIQESTPAKLIKKRRSYNGGGDQLKNNTINVGDVKVRDGKPTCCLCQKKFPSMQSLFGHMRFHSDRGWKGIQPPTFYCNSSSGLDFKDNDEEHEGEDEETYYNHESSDLQDKSLYEVSAIDLMSSLSGKSWVKKDFRGRPSTADLIPQAARDLMTLSKAQGGLVLASNAFKDNMMEIGKKLKYISEFGDIKEANNEISNTDFQDSSSYTDKQNVKRITHGFPGATTMADHRVLGSEPEETDIHEDDHDPDDLDHHNQGRVLGIDLNQPYVMQDGEEDSFSSKED